MTNPNKAHLRLWVAALRGGEFEQTRNELARRDPDTDLPVAHCCLDVANVVAARNGVEQPSWKWSSTNGELTYFWPAVDLECEDDSCGDPTCGTESNSEYMNPATMRWLGLNDPNPYLRWLGWLGLNDPNPYLREDSVSAVSANDLNMWSFAEIADSIERTFGLLEADDAE